MKNALIFGKYGQLSQYFCRDIKQQFICSSSKDFDLRETKKIKQKINKHKPSCVINFSSFNNVDLAEENKDNSLINCHAIKEIAEYCSDNKTPFVHISTDYVFNGKKGNYKESSKVEPINQYGLEKFKGEEYVRNICSNYLIIRTSWLYSSIKNTNNFFNKILELYLKKPERISGAIDSFGSPTSALSLSTAMHNILPQFLNDKGLSGTYHFSNKGSVSRFEFVKRILFFLDTKYNLGLPNLIQVKNSDFSLQAARPENTSLNCEKISSTFGIDIIDWRKGIELETNSLS